ncbi:LAQU0S11e00518g1_1 [Lachancea quebecensis]|uniref:Actin cytoskeleton-regulatory complex protein END3 n=1 Tax=Lachancea quebecensis TaxID=1654605 RepID=A0A0P1KU26_9SACH|nr:LAQU0S11e00518g1_1 [Lachancea quebecensis]
MPKLEQFEIKKYWQIFLGLKPQENKVTHDQVLPILYNSKLDSSILNKIWFLADIDDDDNLDFEEFVICMRLIFDMVNKNIDAVPDDLPDWLIPGSKAKLDAQRRKKEPTEASRAASEASKAVPAPPAAPAAPEAPVVQKKVPELDWYISPANKKLYASTYEACDTFTDGTVSYPVLAGVVRSVFPNVTSNEVDRMWLLVNPQKSPSINRDPAFYLIHALKQRNDLGCELPSDLPNAIKEICNQHRVSYDLNSSQADVKRSSSPAKSADYRTSASVRDRGSNFQSGGGVEGEVGHIKKQMADLDAQPSVTPSIVSTASSAPSDPSTARKQFEELLRYREEQLRYSGNTHTGAINVRGIKEDLETIAQQVGVLEQFLANKKQELQQLQSESRSLSHSERA